MKSKSLKHLTAALLTAILPFSSQATIPVIDYSVLTQAITSAFNNVRQTAQHALAYAEQVRQFETQLQQYAQQLKDGLGLTAAAQIWQQAQMTMGELQSIYGEFANATQLEAQLRQYQNVDYWMTIDPSAYQSQDAGSAAQKKADDAWVKSLAAQQTLLQQDAANLQRLQATASGAQGQMQAIQAASQIAAQQAEQLMEIRALMISEQNALAARQQTLANEEAMKQAASEKFLNGGKEYQQYQGQSFGMP